MMGASQIDRYGNSNISAIGDWAQPKSQLLGMRGAPGNTICNPTSYWIPRQSPRVFVEQVDIVSGVGYDKRTWLGLNGSRFLDLRRVVTDLGVYDFRGPEHQMRLVSVHPGVTVEQAKEAAGFELALPEGGDVPETRQPTAEELRVIREVLDPRALRDKEVTA
jgi:acyl CoA:acetate/3-ketoacid CoA transferase beta subunit